MAKKHINLTLDEYLIDKLKEHCKQEGRSVSSFIEILIRNFFEIEGSEDMSRPLTVELLKEEMGNLTDEMKEIDKQRINTYSKNIVNAVLKELVKKGYITKQIEGGSETDKDK